MWAKPDNNNNNKIIIYFDWQTESYFWIKSIREAEQLLFGISKLNKPCKGLSDILNKTDHSVNLKIKVPFEVDGLLVAQKSRPTERRGNLKTLLKVWKLGKLNWVPIQSASQCRGVQTSAPANGPTELVLWLFWSDTVTSPPWPTYKNRSHCLYSLLAQLFQSVFKGKKCHSTHVYFVLLVFERRRNLMRPVLNWGLCRVSLFFQRPVQPQVRLIRHLHRTTVKQKQRTRLLERVFQIKGWICLGLEMKFQYWFH